MGETLSGQKTPEQRVFGDAFSFSRVGAADEETVRAYFRERLEAIKQGETAWLSRTLDGETGIVADLMKDRKVAATLVYDYDVRAADVYTTSDGGSFGDTTLCEQVEFDDAVTQAEQFVAELP